MRPRLVSRVGNGRLQGHLFTRLVSVHENLSYERMHKSVVQEVNDYVSTIEVRFLPIYLMTDWLDDWLIDWLIDRLLDWLIDRLIDWLIDRLIDWLTDGIIHWLTDWRLQVNRLIDRSHHSFSEPPGANKFGGIGGEFERGYVFGLHHDCQQRNRRTATRWRNRQNVSVSPHFSLNDICWAPRDLWWFTQFNTRCSVLGPEWLNTEILNFPSVGRKRCSFTLTLLRQSEKCRWMSTIWKSISCPSPATRFTDPRYSANIHWRLSTFRRSVSV